jgi:type IV secretory pathway VirB10-like protein
MTEDANPRAVPGDNMPPAFDPDVLAECKAKADDFADAAGAWLDLKEIETAEQSAKLTDFVDGARKIYKHIEDARKKQKKPHDDAGKKVQKAFTPLTEAVEKSVEKVKPLQTAWLAKEEERLEAERAAAAAEAERLRKEAEAKAAEAAARNDVAGEVEADVLAAEAKVAAKAAASTARASAQSATGGARNMSLRTTREAEITNPRLAMMHYQNHPKLLDVLRELASAEVRAAKGADIRIPGVNIIERKTAA